MLEHLLLDVNGTLADRGSLHAASPPASARLRRLLEVQLVTGGHLRDRERDRAGARAAPADPRGHRRREAGAASSGWDVIAVR